ncbi:hypothetical protein ABEO75_09615 [Paenibacillus macerans]|uniref:hypothetical protein n=1 Tax=Paenibacillus macerans TaxID=44252 RepID=UPI002E1C0CA7|nr:hypothetical protein [Paenibacillus macerans]
MLIYITCDIFMAFIEFAFDENGKQPVLDHLMQLRQQAATGDSDAVWLLARIARALNFIQRHGIPGSIGQTLIANDDSGFPLTLVDPVKELVYHQPLLELRVNKPRRTGAYRAIFFPFEHIGNQILVFTHSVIKQSTASPDFEAIVQETKAMLPDFNQNPSKYIHLLKG